MERRLSASETLDFRQNAYTNLVLSAEILGKMCLGLSHHHRLEAISSVLGGNYGRKYHEGRKYHTSLPSPEELGRDLSFVMMELPSHETMFSVFRRDPGPRWGRSALSTFLYGIVGRLTGIGKWKSRIDGGLVRDIWDRLGSLGAESMGVKSKCELNLSELRERATPSDLWVALRILENYRENYRNPDWVASVGLDQLYHSNLAGLRQRIDSGWPYREREFQKVESFVNNMRFSCLVSGLAVYQIHRPGEIGDVDLRSISDELGATWADDECVRAVDTYNKLR